MWLYPNNYWSPYTWEPNWQGSIVWSGLWHPFDPMLTSWQKNIPTKWRMEHAWCCFSNSASCCRTFRAERDIYRIYIYIKTSLLHGNRYAQELWGKQTKIILYTFIYGIAGNHVTVLLGDLEAGCACTWFAAKSSSRFAGPSIMRGGQEMPRVKRSTGPLSPGVLKQSQLPWQFEFWLLPSGTRCFQCQCHHQLGGLLPAGEVYVLAGLL